MISTTFGSGSRVGGVLGRGTLARPEPFTFTVARRSTPSAAQANAGCECSRLGDAHQMLEPLAITAASTVTAIATFQTRSFCAARGTSHAEAVARPKTR